jgi:hypothetical protein
MFAEGGYRNAQPAFRNKHTLPACFLSTLLSFRFDAKKKKKIP